MKVGIYHPFGDFPDNYSLSHVVKEQMLMLTEHGHEVVFITKNNFRAEVPAGVNVKAMLPHNGVKQILEVAKPLIEDCDVVLTHDIVYLGSYKDHADALRQIPAKYRHWSHSAPNLHDRHKAMDGLYIAMNYTDLPLLAEQYGIPQGRCRVVYNPVSPDVYFGWHPFTQYLVDRHDLLDCDVLVTYPLDTGRFQAKGGYKIIKLIEKLREFIPKDYHKLDAKVVFVNAAANTKERTELVKKVASEYAIFTSIEAESYEPPIDIDYQAEETSPIIGTVTTTTTPPPPLRERDSYKLTVCVPRQVARELMQISNLFPLFSDSEGCSLTLLEASLCKNLIVLNEDFPPMKEFGGIDDVLYMKLGSTRARTSYSDENKYYADWARNVWSFLENSRMNRMNRKVLKRFNREWIYKNQLEPLLT